MKLLLKTIVWLLSAMTLLAACAGAYFWYIWSSNLPYIGSLKEYRPPIITEIFSDDNEVIGRFWDEKRIVIPLDQLPEHLIHAFVAAEDARFFEHEGVDVVSIVRAFLKNITAGRIEQGGSTITQQMTRSLLLRNTRRTYRRKVREVILAIQFEKSFSKEQILFLYLNQIYLGHGTYGVETAARTYFGKSARDLTIAESALLAGLPQAPSRYSPVSHLDRARARQKYVLGRMLAEGYVSKAQFKDAIEWPINIRSEMGNTFKKAPYFTEHVRRYLLKKYGRDMLYRGGLKVYTSVDLSMQRAAVAAIKKGLEQLDRREGYGGLIRRLGSEEVAAYKAEATARPQQGSVVEALVEKVDGEKGEVLVLIGRETGRIVHPEATYPPETVKGLSDVARPGDLVLVRLMKEDVDASAWEVSLEQTPGAQCALFCMVPETGEVKAMVGGRDFADSQFNRAIQSRRQPGSAFKPFIYAAALDWGMSPGEIIMDAPYISDQNPDTETWKPKNYKGKFFGPTLFRTGLIKSRNVITVKILKKIGMNPAIDYVRRMGFESPLSPDLSLALGSSGVSLMELTRAYAVFANGGMLVKPIFIKKIVDRSGQVIEENQPELSEAISKETAYVMTDLLKAVVKEGTGWRVKALNRPAAGKTGTTNNLRDAWFMGYTPGLVSGTWVGYDDQKEMGKGETGSRAASPIWLDFMSHALEERPVVDFQVPEGVVFAKIDAETGLLASPHSKKTVFQAFREGEEPKEYSPAPKSPKSGQFFQYDMDEAR